MVMTEQIAASLSTKSAYPEAFREDEKRLLRFPR